MAYQMKKLNASHVQQLVHQIYAIMQMKIHVIKQHSNVIFLIKIISVSKVVPKIVIPNKVVPITP
jgi:hypothetical protein